MLTPEDDKRHAPSSDDPLWGESWYFNLYDPEQDIAFFTRIGIYPNQGKANVSVLLAVGGREVYNRAWHHLPLPSGDIDSGLELGGVSYQALELLRRYQVTFNDELTPLKIDIAWEAIMPAHNAMAGQAANSATGFHLEQAGRVTGNIRLREREWRVEGFGNRDHSTGIRNWSAFSHHELAWPVFEDNTALGILRIHFVDGRHADLCWAFDGKVVRPLTLDSYVTSLNSEGKAMSAEISATDDQGTHYQLNAVRMAVCHWPFDGYLLNEGAFEYQLSDGRIGYGLLELGVGTGGYGGC